MLLRHSFVMLFGNFTIALRLSAVLFAVQIIQIVYFAYPISDGEAADLALNTQFWLILFIQLMVFLITSLWFAVAWHRFILREEVPTKLLPKFHGWRFWAYFWQGLLLGTFVTFLSALILVLLLFQKLSEGEYVTFGPQTMLLFSIASAIAGPVFYRFATILPAAALGKRFTWGAAWRATKGTTGSLLLVSLVLIGGFRMADWFATKLISDNFFLLVLWDIPFQWFGLMINVSILTTLYGHYVEKRALV